MVPMGISEVEQGKAFNKFDSPELAETLDRMEWEVFLSGEVSLRPILPTMVVTGLFPTEEASSPLHSKSV